MEERRSVFLTWALGIRQALRFYITVIDDIQNVFIGYITNTTLILFQKTFISVFKIGHPKPGFKPHFMHKFGAIKMDSTPSFGGLSLFSATVFILYELGFVFAF